MNISTFDLNHGRALHHLLEEAHVTRAARRLGITPAAASNALRRLRVSFDDPLLVRAGRSLVRTARGEALRGPARDFMRAAERLLGEERFDPATTAFEIIVASSDRVVDAILPALERELAARAPSAALVLRQTTADIGHFLREVGGVAVIPTQAIAPDLRSEPLYADDFVCVVRRGHPNATGPWSIDSFLALDHVLVAPLGRTRRGMVDDALALQGRSRRITRIVTTFGSSLPLIRGSDRVAVLPRAFAEAHLDGLVALPVPVPLAPVPMVLAWHPAREHDPRHLFARSLVREVVRGLRPDATGSAE